MDLEASLPPHLQGPATTIQRIAVGLSGAGVYRVEAGGERFVLKTTDESEPAERWQRRLGIQQSAASAGLAPPIVHVDPARRAVLSAFVVDRGFPPRYADPRTHAAAVVQLGQTLRRVHELAIPPGAVAPDVRQWLADLWSELSAVHAAPAFAGEAIERVLAEVPPDSGRAAVLSHNDVNPTNLVFDGERLMLLDWDTAAPSDPFYDLAAISVFLRMDDVTCRRLLEAHDGAPVSDLPARFGYDRRFIAVLCGAMFVRLARQAGHPGPRGDETRDAAPSLVEFYQRLRAGEWSVAAPEGQWWFGLALLKASFGL